jgi:hypothetical protein
MPSNDYILNQMRSDALAFYGLGEGDVTEFVKVAAVVERVTQDSVLCTVLDWSGERPAHQISSIAGGTPTVKRCEFRRDLVTLYFYSLERAVVRIPKAFLPAFCLWKYELTGKTLAELEQRVAANLALPSSRPAVVEKIGAIRI